MKKKLIFLDFTSLLDVIMIILFFFIIFSKIETDEYRQGLEEQQNQIAAQQAQYQQELEARETEIQIKEDKADIVICDFERIYKDKIVHYIQKPTSLDNSDIIADMLEGKIWGHVGIRW